jgi:ABC-2 type transport system ATP-binding protein
MILFEGVRAKALPDTASGRTGALYKSLSFHLGAGCHAVVGADPAAARLLLDLASGRALARGGKVRVFDAAPSAVAARIAYVPKDVVLPESMTVKGVVELDIAIRGSRKTPGKSGDPTSRLATLDCSHLAERPMYTLSVGETRAVALAIALTSNADLVLIEEPFVGISGRAAPKLASAVQAFVGKSTMVLVTTASLHDAKLLGAQVTSLSNERLVPRSYGTHASAGAGTEDVLFVIASDNMRLAAAIASEGVAQDLRVEHGALEIRTRDLEAAAAAIARAALHESLTIVSLSSESREGARVVERAASALSSLRPPAPIGPGAEAIDPTLPPPARVPVDAVAVSSSPSTPSEGS